MPIQMTRTATQTYNAILKNPPARITPACSYPVFYISHAVSLPPLVKLHRRYLNLNSFCQCLTHTCCISPAESKLCIQICIHLRSSVEALLILCASCSASLKKCILCHLCSAVWKLSARNRSTRSIRSGFLSEDLLPVSYILCIQRSSESKPEEPGYLSATVSMFMPP